MLRRGTFDPELILGLVKQGHRRAAARLMRYLDDGHAAAFEVMKELYPLTGTAKIVGVTGNPGSGKSTLVNRLIAVYRSQGERVGVIAIDPSSPFSGGAILGDRIRMQQFATDDGVFIRSQATRGNLGGLARSTNDAVHVLDAMGYDRVLVETVGVGQDEVDVMQLAHTVVVVMVPGLGDDIQAIKAGLLEIADIFVVNKADHVGVDMTLKDLRQLQHLRERVLQDWTAPILKTIATKNVGVAELVEAAENHLNFLRDSGQITQRLERRASASLVELLTDRLRRHVMARLDMTSSVSQIVADIARRGRNPYSEADLILQTILKPL